LKATDNSDYYVKALNDSSTVMVGKAPAGTAMKVDAQNNKTFETYMVMPAQTIAGGIELYLYTTDGAIYHGTKSGNIDFSRNTPKKLEFLTMDIAVDEPYIIASQKDWNEVVSQLSKGDEPTFIIADPDFTITNDMKYPEKCVITINGDLNVSGDNVTIKNVDVKGTITVEKGAKLTTDVTAKAANIINKGTVVVAANPEVEETRAAAVEGDANNDGLYDYTISAIENHATLTINKDAVITTALTNLKGATVDNAGELTVSGSNKGTINNTGYIDVNEVADAVDFTNDVREYEGTGEDRVLVNEPTINNKATGSFRANGVMSNASLIVNEGILSCANNEGEINNAEYGVIDSKTGCTTFITDNAGKVIVYNMLQENISIAGGTGHVEYTSTAANGVETVNKSIVTDIVATKNIEVKYTDATGAEAHVFDNLIVKGNATIKLTWHTANTDYETIKLFVESGTATLASNVAVDSLYIAEGASVSIPKDYTLTVSGKKLDNQGMLTIAGKLVVESYAEGEIGRFNDNGNGLIDYKDTPLDVAKEDYIKAYANAIADWAAWDATATHSVKTLKYNLKGTGAADKFKVAYDAGKNTAGSVYETLEKELEDYNNLWKLEKKYDADKTIAFCYSDAVDKFISNMEAAGTPYKTFLKTFKVAVGANVSRFYTASEDGTVTAAAAALADFKDLVCADTQDGFETEYKCVLNTKTAYTDISAYIPAYTFAFETDYVYMLYANVIEKYNGAFKNLGNNAANVPVTGAVAKSYFIATSLSDLTGFVKNASNVTDGSDSIDEIAKAYVNETRSEVAKAILTQSLKWKYDIKTIEKISEKAKAANN